MSVSLALIPIALTLRLVMGKNNFKNWVDSIQVKAPTAFKDEHELVRTVRKAGYDADKLGSVLKTHIDGENLFIFWELVDNQWTAIYEKSGSNQKIEKFMADVNRAAGRNVFELTQVQEQVDNLTPLTQQTVTPAPTFPTNFRDQELLFRTLKEFGVNPVRQGSNIECAVEDSLLIFQQSQDDGPIYVEIHHAPDLHKVFNYLSDIDDDYKRCLQSIVYEKLKDRVAEKNMTIESEEVLEDNSIVVTLNIRN